MATKVRFWVDPLCPWCWVTSQWVRTIADEKQLDVVWEPISLFLKNAPDPAATHYNSLVWSFGLLKVMESVRQAEGDAPLGPLYKEYGRRIHHLKERLFDPAEALEAVGVDPKHAVAAADESFDAVVRERHEQGLALVGNDVGTPIIAIPHADGTERAIFGPVITRVPVARADALALWDSTVFLTNLDGFWELKRTRTESPDVGEWR